MRLNRTVKALVLSLAMLVAVPLAQTEANANQAPSVGSVGTKAVGLTTNVWGTVPGGGNAEVWTEVRLDSGAWSVSQRRTADGNGYYVIPLTYGASNVGTYTYRVGARQADGSTVHSAPFTLNRVHRPSAHTAGTKTVGQITNTWGTFPGGAGIEVWTEALVGGSWSVSQRRTADANGYFVIPLTYGATTPGAHRFRVAGRYADGSVVHSSPFTLQRTPQQCSRAAGIESGLTRQTVSVLRDVCSKFPDINRFLGYRGSAGSHHSDGRAIDVMVSGQRGWDVAHYAQRNAGRLGITEVIYERKIWTTQRAGDGWRWMEDRGSVSANHYDHVHITVGS